MKNKSLMLVLLFLIPVTLMAQQPAAQSGPTSLSDVAHFEDRPSFPARSLDDHSGLSTGQRGSHPPAQCTCVRLCVGGLDNHAGERWKGGDADTGPDFYEGPDDVHVVGRNASSTRPAKFVVFFIKDKGAPVLVPAPE